MRAVSNLWLPVTANCLQNVFRRFFQTEKSRWRLPRSSARNAERISRGSTVLKDTRSCTVKKKSNPRQMLRLDPFVAEGWKESVVSARVIARNSYIKIHTSCLYLFKKTETMCESYALIWTIYPKFL